jgi:hypothetical protein
MKKGTEKGREVMAKESLIPPAKTTSSVEFKRHCE